MEALGKPVRGVAVNWVVSFVLTFLVALFSNYWWGIPFQYAVDVQLSVMISFYTIMIIVFAVISAIMLLTGNIISAVVFFLVTTILVALVSYAPVAAFEFYGYAFGESVASSGVYFKYYDYVKMVTSPIVQLVYQTAQIRITQDQIEWSLKILSGAAAVISILSNIRNFQKRGAEA